MNLLQYFENISALTKINYLLDKYVLKLPLYHSKWDFKEETNVDMCM